MTETGHAPPRNQIQSVISQITQSYGAIKQSKTILSAQIAVLNRGESQLAAEELQLQQQALRDTLQANRYESTMLALRAQANAGRDQVVGLLQDKS
jgi:hypothetical protein